MTKTVYLAGGQKSLWQDAFINSIADVEWVDPRSHGLNEEKAYTAWDLAGIRRSDLVIAYLDEANPSGYGMSLEVGFAHALGIPVWYVCEDRTPRQRYFGMVRSVEHRYFDSLSEAVKAIESIDARAEAIRIALAARAAEEVPASDAVVAALVDLRQTLGTDEWDGADGWCEAVDAMRHELAERIVRARAALSAQQAPAVACKTCGGKRFVHDGWLEGEGGVEFDEPIACTKDCPDCATTPAASQSPGVPAGIEGSLTNLQTWLICRLIGNAGQPSVETIKTWISALASALGSEVPSFAAAPGAERVDARDGERMTESLRDSLRIDWCERHAVGIENLGSGGWQVFGDDTGDGKTLRAAIDNAARIK